MGELKVLAKGVDTLHVSGKGAVRADVWDQVDALRKLGELNESAEMVEFQVPYLSDEEAVRLLSARYAPRVVEADFGRAEAPATGGEQSEEAA